MLASLRLPTPCTRFARARTSAVEGRLVSSGGDEEQVALLRLPLPCLFQDDVDSGCEREVAVAADDFAN